VPNGPTGALRFVAGLSLIGGIVGGIAVIVAFWEQETLSTDSLGGVDVSTEANPAAFLIGIAFFLQGLLVWAALSVLASLAENVGPSLGVPGN
jgi:hypothetical protein